METKTLPPMRGIKQAIQELKQADPNTCLTEKALRRLIISGEIPSVNIGKKYLVNMDILSRYLSGDFTNAASRSAIGIRKIAQ